MSPGDDRVRQSAGIYGVAIASLSWFVLTVVLALAPEPVAQLQDPALALIKAL